jgi:hypothetical protein
LPIFGNVVLGASISALVGIIALVVYTSIYNSLNTAGLSSSVTSMLAVIPIVLAAVIVISIVVLGFSFALGGRR